MKKTLPAAANEHSNLEWVRTRVEKVVVVVRSGRRISFSRVNFVCRLLFGVRSSSVLPQWHVKDPGHSAKMCRWQVTPKHTYTLDPTKSEWVDYATVQA